MQLVFCWKPNGLILRKAVPDLCHPEKFVVGHAVEDAPIGDCARPYWQRAGTFGD